MINCYASSVIKISIYYLVTWRMASVNSVSINILIYLFYEILNHF